MLALLQQHVSSCRVLPLQVMLLPPLLPTLSQSMSALAGLTNRARVIMSRRYLLSFALALEGLWVIAAQTIDCGHSAAMKAGCGRFSCDPGSEVERQGSHKKSLAERMSGLAGFLAGAGHMQPASTSACMLLLVRNTCAGG